MVSPAHKHDTRASCAETEYFSCHELIHCEMEREREGEEGEQRLSIRLEVVPVRV